jgi:hypothetical protein
MPERLCFRLVRFRRPRRSVMTLPCAVLQVYGKAAVYYPDQAAMPETMAPERVQELFEEAKADEDGAKKARRVHSGRLSDLIST